MDMNINRDRVRELRLNKSWSQEKLAEEAGVSLRTVQRVETDGAASHQSCRAIAQALGVQPAEIRSIAAGSNGSSVERPAKSVVATSPSMFWFLRITQLLVVSLLWLVMAGVGLTAIAVAIGGIFFWEQAAEIAGDPLLEDLSAAQGVGGGLLTAFVLVLVLLLFRMMYRGVKRMEISRQETSEAAGS